MSLTVTVKDELALVVTENAAQRRAEVSAMLRFAGGLHIVSGRIVVEAELDHGGAVRRLHQHLKELYGMEPEVMVVQGGSLHRGSRYVLRVTQRGKDLARLSGLVDDRGRPVRGMPVAVVQGGRNAAAAAWRGAFLARGSLTEPGRSSSLEVTCPGSEAALALVGAARRFDISAAWSSVTVRPSVSSWSEWVLQRPSRCGPSAVPGASRGGRPTVWPTSTTRTCVAPPAPPWPRGLGSSAPSRSWGMTSPATCSRPVSCGSPTSRPPWRSSASSPTPS